MEVRPPGRTPPTEEQALSMSTRDPKRLVSEHFRSDGAPKRRFATREEAEKYAELYGYDHIIYPCSFCRGYHFGTRKGASYG